jgi:predicted DNA binding CopG/RHH family protein
MGVQWTCGNGAKYTMSEQEKRLSVRLPSDLHRAVKLKAVRADRPISTIVRELLRKWVEDDSPSEEEEGQGDK